GTLAITIHLSGADIDWLLETEMFPLTDDDGGSETSDRKERVEDKHEVALPSKEGKGIESDKSVLE
ncbi:hypothetical protein CHS0354_042676, partial [Potamilus streckersoni]